MTSTAVLGLLLALVAAPAAAATAADGPAIAHAGVRTAAQQCSPEEVAYLAAEPPALVRLGAREAWRTATGAGVVVAVVDSGVDPGNAHLTGVVLPGVDLLGLGGDPRGWTDPAGHGTAVAGQIASRPVEGSGLVGLAPNATILPVRVYQGSDEQSVEAGVGPRTDRVAAGIIWAAENGAQVINVSISSTVDDPAMAEAVRLATERGALVVASAGNRNTTDETEDSPRYPAAYEGVLGVAAVNDSDAVTEDSIHGPHVDVMAPGTNVITAFHAAGDCQLGGEASTSYATAYVSAAAALIAEAYPEETPAQWAHRLEVTAARFAVDRRDDRSGWGVIRPTAALAFIDDGSAPGPDSPVHERPEPVVPEVAELELGATEDVLAPVQAISSWWLLAGVAACVAALVGARLTSRRRRAGPIT